MRIIYMRKSERLKAEAYAGVLLAIITFVFSWTWWLKAVLASILAGIFVHLIFILPLTRGLKTIFKVAICLVAIAMIASITWNPIPAQILNDRVGNADKANESRASGIVEGLKNIPGLISSSTKTNQTLQSDTANLVKQLREFQRKVDDWNNTAASRLNQDGKNEKSYDEASKLFLERAQELSASMANLDREFNNELKPRVIALRSQLLSRLPPGSVPAKRTVDWTLKYGFSTFPKAVNDIADYLESLASMLPEK
jgi:hypothetical protein